MVGDNAHGDVRFFVLSIGKITNLSDFSNERSENIGIVIGGFTLNSHTQSFEAHAGIDYFGWKSFE
ncbi:hypothetical protein SDC9_122799 [bioreactor metagenome]|uniref:Uncharacterized protein n=1 Tax=bioreactor metagenome TaxID=1076179 RepID=A0A645CFY8_9ZZZZ